MIYEKNARQKNSDCNMSLFFSLLKDKCDLENVAILLSLLSNEWDEDEYMQKKLVFDTMKLSPTKYILEYAPNKETKSNRTYYHTLTKDNISNLLTKLQTILVTHGSVEKAYLTMQKSNKKKYPHEILALMLGGDTGFPTVKTNSTYYRLNLLFYWLVEKYKIWDKVSKTNALIPCNDAIFYWAYRQGIIKKRMKANLKNTIILTRIAKKTYNDDFYILYEKLNNVQI